jgi:predicted dehydrogenase
MKTVTTGVVLLSFAHSHQYHWGRAFLNDARCKVLGAWDADPERGARAAADLGVRFFSELDDILSLPEVTAVAICAANADKPELVKTAAKRGLHVLCEKPTATTLRDVWEMSHAVEEAGVTFVQSFPHRLIPANRHIKDLLASGKLGKVGLVRKRHGHGAALTHLAASMPWIVDAQQSGGGALLDEGIHEMDLLRYNFGDPLSVTAEIGTLQTDLSVEDTGVALFRFPENILVELSAGWTWPAGGPTTEIYGTNGTLIQSFTDLASNAAPDPSRMHLRLWSVGDDQWQDLGYGSDFKGIHAEMARHFLAVITEGIAPCAGMLDGLKSLEMAIGCYVSAKEGRRVDFPLPGGLVNS